MEPKIVEKDQIILVGFSFYGDPFAESGGWTEENEIGRLWSRFEAFMVGNAGRIKHLADPGAGYEVHVWNEETAARGHADVFAGMAVEKLEDVPVEVLVKILPPTTYAVFTLKGKQAIIDWTKMVYEEWLPGSGYDASAYDYNIQRYDQRYKGVDRLDESVIEVYVPVKKAEDVPDGDL
jgi:predicted transcriptional regulator YdeE